MLSYDELISSKRPVYVVNNSNPRSIISITLTSSDGRRSSAEIPKTSIPICITELFPRKLLQDNIDIMSFINKCILKLVGRKKAEAILSTPEGIKEKARLSNSKLAAKDGTGFSKASKELREAKRDTDRLIQQAESQANTNSANVDDTLIKDSIMDICNRLEVGTTSSADALVELKNIESTLTENDLKYIIAQVTESKTIKKYASSLLSEVTNGTTKADSDDEDDDDLDNEKENDIQPKEDGDEDEDDLWEEEDGDEGNKNEKEDEDE